MHRLLKRSVFIPIAGLAFSAAALAAPQAAFASSGGGCSGWVNVSSDSTLRIQSCIYEVRGFLLFGNNDVESVLNYEGNPGFPLICA